MKWLTGVFVVLLVTIVVAADRGQLPWFVVAIYSFPGGDKVGHFVLMGILSFLVNFALMSHSRLYFSTRILLANIILLALVAVEEFSQSFFSTRTASWDDLASSYAGILSFAGLAVLLLHRR